MSNRLVFVVHGVARTAGSKQTFPVLDRQGNPVRTKQGRILTRAKHDNPKTSQWMGWVAQVARKHFHGDLLTGALSLTLRFHRARPKGHYGTGRNIGKLKASAPTYPITKPDATKLLRAVEDSLTYVVWRDDAQVRRLNVTERYGTHSYVRIIVRSLK